MFYLLLESIYVYGELNDDTEILIYTSSNFMKKIRSSHLFSKKIYFEINDTYNNLDLSCRSRLDIFNFEIIKKYDKILYIDIDIIVKGDLNKIFDLCKLNLLYVLEEGAIDNDLNYWGKTLFTQDEINKYTDKSAFTSGIILFKNCDTIRELFDIIKKDMNDRYHYFYDQPFIVYNSFKYNLYDNKILKRYVINNEYFIHSDKIIHHFPGGPGVHEHKIKKMRLFLNSLKDYTITDALNKAKKYIDDYLLKIIKDSNELLEGNIFMTHLTTNYTDEFLNKTKNISNVLLNRNLKKVMEIGFNSGFSVLLMLLTNPNIVVTCVDIGEHIYVKPCYEKLKETFGDRIQLIIGDSTKILLDVTDKYDLIHIDGGHSTKVATCDIINSYNLSKKGTILIMDDYDFTNLHVLWDSFVTRYNLKKLDIDLYECIHHDIKYV